MADISYTFNWSCGDCHESGSEAGTSMNADDYVTMDWECDCEEED